MTLKLVSAGTVGIEGMSPQAAVESLERSLGYLNGRAAARLSRAIAMASMAKHLGARRGPLVMGLAASNGFLLALSALLPHAEYEGSPNRTTEGAQAELAKRLITQSDYGMLAMAAGFDAALSLLEGTAPPTARALPNSEWRAKVAGLRANMAAGLDRPGAADDRPIARR